MVDETIDPVNQRITYIEDCQIYGLEVASILFFPRLETTQQAYLYITAYLERKRKVPRDLLYIRGIATAALNSQVYGDHLKTTVPPKKIIAFS